MLPFVSQQLPVIRWHRVEQGRLVALDLRIHVRRAGRPRPEDRRRADREGKGQCIAQSISEEQLRHRKGPVFSGDAQHALRVADHRIDDVVVEMDGPLGEAGGTRRVEPERRVILTGGFQVER